jgi:RNA 2',3'-cyclic 3'-phosphodiesterase
MRLFISVPIPPTLSAIFSELSAQSIDRLKWTTPQNLHATIFFIGSCNEDPCQKIKIQLAQLAPTIQPFSLNFDQLTFGTSNKPASMLWAKFHESDTWSNLVTQVQSTVKLAMPSVKTYSPKHQIPHITLARFSFKNKQLTEKINLQAIDLPAFKLPINNVQLMQSQLHPHGSVYTTIQTYTLGKKAC